MNRLWVRLSLAFTVVVMLGVLIVGAIGFLITDINVRRHFLVREAQDPGGLIDTLADHYRTEHSWQGVDVLLDGAQSAFPFKPRGGLAFVLTDGTGRVVGTSRGLVPGKALDPAQFHDALPVRVDDRVVGYFVVLPAGGKPQERDWPPPPAENQYSPPIAANDRQPWDPGISQPPDRFQPERISPPPPPSPGIFFLQSISRTLWWTALFFGVLGILFGVLMSRNLTAPLRHLAEAAQAIGRRDYGHHVEVKGIDEVKEVARAFNEMVDDLQQAETLRRNLLADVAHELRTPLSVLQGNLRAILDGVYSSEQEEIARLYDQTRLLSHLVEDLHELARAEARQLPLNLQAIDLSKLAHDVVNAFEPAAEGEGIDLTLSTAENLPDVQADPDRLKQVLGNLLSNALRHTPEGGKITVSTGHDNAHVWLAVEDTGEGISAEDLPHVFDRFYRADRTRTRATGGTGLGLAIVRVIVEMHGGEICAESDGAAGHGSRFIVQLPT